MNQEKQDKESDRYKLPFEKLDVWHKSKVLVKDVYAMTKEFPEHERYGFVSQMNRSALSIASNIAEGASRTSRKEQAHFTEIAYGSLMELLCQIIIAHELSYISHDLLNELRRKSEEIAKMLSAMRRFQTKD